MRERETRIWDYQHKCMSYEGESRIWVDPVGVVHSGVVWGLAKLYTDWKSYGKLKFEIMNYTSVEDDDNKKIFESDIVTGKVVDLSDEYIKYKIITNEVKFVEGCFKIGMIPLYSVHSRRLLGNKFENPELLK